MQAESVWYNLFLLVVLLAGLAFPVGIIWAFESGDWQWLLLPAISALFFHLALK